MSVDTIFNNLKNAHKNGIYTGFAEDEAVRAFHSLLISKLPEKRKDTRGNTQNPNNAKYLTKTATGFNEAIDEMHRVIDGLFNGV